MKRAKIIVLLIAVTGAIACGVSFAFALSREDTFASAAFAAACMFCISSAVMVIKKR